MALVHVVERPGFGEVTLTIGAEAVAYNPAPVPDVHLTLPLNVDRLNFGLWSRQETLGWVGKRGLDGLWAKNALGQNLTSAIFSMQDGELRLAHPSRLVMVTTNSEIAKSD